MKRKAIVLVWAGSGGAGFISAGDKLFCPILGRPLVSYALDAAAGLGPRRMILAIDDVDKEAAGRLSPRIPLTLVGCKERAGRAGGAMMSALLEASPLFRAAPSSDVILIPADRPLLQSATLRSLLGAHRRKACSLTLLSCGPDIDRDSVAVFRAADLVPILPSVARAKGKAGFPMIADLLAARGKTVGLTENPDADEILRVAARTDLARAARLLRERKNGSLSRRGVTLLDPQSTWIDWEAEIGAGTVVYPSVVIEGKTRLGKDCRIHPHVHIMGSRLGDRVKVLSSTVLEDCRLENDAQVGPFSRLRPGTVIRTGSKVGNFVEMKNTVFGPRSKAQHLSYLGDSLVEEDVNVGAGTITCNYDGVRKNRTHIEAGAFIGSGTELVAPVKVGKRAYVAAGSTITRDVGPGSLAIGRARQVEKPGWVMERIKKLQRKTRAHK